MTNSDTFAARSRYLARLVWTVLRRPKQTRDTTEVLQEYSDGWSQYRSQLERAASLQTWLRVPGFEDQPGYASVEGRLSYGVFDSLGYYRDVLLEALQKHFPGARSIAEYGAGIGRNLLFLKSRLPQLSVYGYELCPPGVEIGQGAAAKFSLEARYAQLDYVRDPPDKYCFGTTDVGYTMFSLEQLPRSNARALRNILDRVRLGSIHIEPVPENYPLTPRGLLGRLDHWKVDYLSGFDKAVRQLDLAEVSVHRLMSAHNPLMFPSVYVLKKR